MSGVSGSGRDERRIRRLDDESHSESRGARRGSARSGSRGSRTHRTRSSPRGCSSGARRCATRRRRSAPSSSRRGRDRVERTRIGALENNEKTVETTWHVSQSGSRRKMRGGKTSPRHRTHSLTHHRTNAPPRARRSIDRPIDRSIDRSIDQSINRGGRAAEGEARRHRRDAQPRARRPRDRPAHGRRLDRRRARCRAAARDLGHARRAQPPVRARRCGALRRKVVTRARRAGGLSRATATPAPNAAQRAADGGAPRAAGPTAAWTCAATTAAGARCSEAAGVLCASAQQRRGTRRRDRSPRHALGARLRHGGRSRRHARVDRRARRHTRRALIARERFACRRDSPLTAHERDAEFLVRLYEQEGLRRRAVRADLSPCARGKSARET